MGTSHITRVRTPHAYSTTMLGCKGASALSSAYVHSVRRAVPCVLISNQRRVAGQGHTHTRAYSSDKEKNAGGAANFMDTGVNRVGRFWNEATVVTLESGGYSVLLDGRRLKSTPPNGVALDLPARALAEAIAAEWNRQGKLLAPHTMPFTGLAFTAATPTNNRARDVRIDNMIRFLETDTLLCRDPCDENSDADQRRFERAQQQTWDPLVEWFNQKYTANVTPSTGLLPPPLSTETRANVTKALEDMNELELVACEAATSAAKSLIIALALGEGAVEAKDAVTASRLELMHQIERWGMVEDSHDVELEDTGARLASAALVMRWA